MTEDEGSAEGDVPEEDGTADGLTVVSELGDEDEVDVGLRLMVGAIVGIAEGEVVGWQESVGSLVGIFVGSVVGS